MKTIIVLFIAFFFAACGSTVPVTANPDKGTTTTGGTGSAEVTEGTSSEGMNTSRTGARPDSARVKKDSLQFRR